MKRYKKILVIAPLACMLSIGVLNSQNTAHAASAGSSAQMSKLREGETFNFAQLQADIQDRALAAAIHLNKDPNNTVKSVNIGGDLDASKMHYGSISIDNTVNVDAHVDSYKDLGQTNLVTINNNDGTVAQQANTPETTIKQTETSSYSNTEGIKLGASATLKLDVKVPFVADGGASVTTSTEFNYAHGDTQTSTKETDITFKSQPVVAAPGGTTTYYGSTKTANFSGMFHGSKAPIEQLDLSYSEAGTGSGGNAPNISGERLYAIFKYGDKPVPDYLTLDDTNKRVLINHDTDFKVTGQGGFYTDITVKFVPKDHNKTPQTMPYAEYAEKLRSKTL